MDQAAHKKTVSFLWGIADDVLRDLFKRGKYPDVILPMCVLRRMDAVLEPTKKAVLETQADARPGGHHGVKLAALAAAAGNLFTTPQNSPLRDLKSRSSQQQLLADFEDYLNGFSLGERSGHLGENFKFRNQILTLSKPDSLGALIAKFPGILRSTSAPDRVLNADRTVKHPGDGQPLHAGTVFRGAWSASLTRRTTSRRASTGHPATPSG